MKTDSNQKDSLDVKNFNRISISNAQYPIVTDLNIALIDLKFEKINYDEVAILYTELEKSLSEIVKLKSRYKEDLSKFSITGIKSNCEEISSPLKSKTTFYGMHENLSNPSSSNISSNSISLNGTLKNNYDQQSLKKTFRQPLNKKIKHEKIDTYKSDYDKQKLDIQKLNLEYNIDVPNEFWKLINTFFEDINASHISEMTKLLPSPLSKNKIGNDKVNLSEDIPPLGKRRYLQKCNRHRRKFKVSCPKCEIVFLNKPQIFQLENFKENDMIKMQDSLMDLDNEHFGVESPFKLLTTQMVYSLLRDNLKELEAVDVKDLEACLLDKAPPGEPMVTVTSRPPSFPPTDRLKRGRNIDSLIPAIRSFLTRGKERGQGDDEVLREILSCKTRLQLLSDEVSPPTPLDPSKAVTLPAPFLKAYTEFQGLSADLVQLDEEIKELYKKHRKLKLKKKEVPRLEVEKLEKKLVERERLCELLSNSEA